MKPRMLKAQEQLADFTDQQLADFAKVARGRARDYARLAAQHQSAASRYARELRRRKRERSTTEASP